ncbi:MAG TPA: methyltransferase domain-containing protein [Leptospiraceae bacterium]|nr:class I SAM-dependent methyltransferase [Leptospirales bacterium]HMU83118.1 methyltransferase domain-containing protein [Leptospiraceae bacterium]HMW58472.1 methyltransferase domain-containing protein [Leptospiraceae bacterium]HMX56282.1 methyltransferase domain-containing protein [Leptospiraceae bacterium]HMY47614.1 methyltransferase domain-containing protein [Leptospiraceae bacterium]
MKQSSKSHRQKATKPVDTLQRLLGRRATTVRYQSGFLVRGRLHPFLDLAKDQGDAGWSNDIANDLEEHSQHHFIDVYNRRLAVEGLRPALSIKGAAFLDAGCSSGYLLADVQAAFPDASLFGADFFPAGLAHCHRAHPEIPLFRMDLTACPFPDNSFDALSCLNVLEHIQDDLAAARTLFRILKPAGLAAITVPAAPHLYDLFDEIHFHERRYSLLQTQDLLRAAGFKIRFANYFGSLIYPAFYAVKRRNQNRYGALSFEQKRDLAMSQIQKTSQSRIMNAVCRFEEAIGKRLTYPFGIRACVIAEKPPG